MCEGVEGERPVSRAAGIRVREGDLGARTLIGSGAASEVHRLDSFTLPGHQGGVAFVRVRDGRAPQWDSAVLARLVALRWGLDAAERLVLDGVAAWPLAVVEGDDGEVVGCLVPLAAHPFYYVPADDPNHQKQPQTVKWLITAPKRARRAGAAAVSERDLAARATVLARVSLLLALLHREGVVFGDLSERAVLVGTGEVAQAFVVGCEGAAFSGEATPQRDSAVWTAPETVADRDGAGGHPSTSVQTTATDLYKLGLLVLRVLAPAGHGLERSRDASRADGVLDQTGLRMLVNALGDDPAARPTAVAWYEYLRGVLVQSLSAPEIHAVDVSPVLVAEGDEVRLTVSLAGAKRLTIEMPGRADITREVGSRIVTERFTARQSGRIGVRAVNEHGEASAVTPVVRVLPVPSPARLAVATPEVPASLGVLPDLARLEAAMGISLPDASAGSGSASGSGSPAALAAGVARMRERIEADALPLHDLLRIGVEAERVSRERDRGFPSAEEFLAEVSGAGPGSSGRAVAVRGGAASGSAASNGPQVGPGASEAEPARPRRRPLRLRDPKRREQDGVDEIGDGRRLE